MSLTRLAAFGCMIGLLACGLQPVELVSTTRVLGPDEFIEPDVPADAVARLRNARGEQGPEMLQFLYPLPPELVVPSDLAPIAFEWSAGKGKPAAMPMGMMMPPAMPMEPPPPPAAGAAAPMPDDMMGPKADKKAEKEADKDAKERVVAYELRAHSDAEDVRLYAAAERAAFPIQRWRSLLDKHRAATLTIELRGLKQSGEFVHAQPLALRVRAAMPLGVFYSFSATAQGLTRAQLKDTHEQIEEVRAPLEAAKTQRCVGCHAISRDGRQVVATSLEPSRLLRWSWTNEPAWQAAWPGTADPSSYIQATFDPTATRIAATRSGQLQMFNADTGMLLDRSAAPLMAAVAAPDWSPNGRSIVVETGRDMPEADGGSLATFDVGVYGSLSELKPLINATGDEHLRSPSYSPNDGEWIVYERRMGPAGEGKDSKLFVVRARGGEPIELKALQKGVRPMDGASSPSFAEGDAPGHVYVLFSSRRPVGNWVPEEGKRQLFAAELDLSLALDGKDPSHAAFWLPFQQRANSYIRTQWAPAQADCTHSLEVCDDADDDCDQQIDEDCCPPAAAESCNDSMDNDCDGRVDEGCDCKFQETCENSKDDDCDLRVDEKPCMPAPAMR